MPERGWGTRPAITVLSALALGAVCVTTTQADAATTATSTSEQQAMSSWVSQQLAGMTLEQKVGQLFMTYVHGTAANQADPANKSEFGVDTPAEVVQKYHLGGVIYFANSTVNNLVNPTQIAELSNGLQGAALASGAHLPLEISTDQEEGTVTRIGSPATVFPGNMAIGAGRRTDDARKAADITGHELRAMGINVNNAPDADVNSNPANPIIGVRSFAGDPTLAASMDSAAVDGYQDSDRPDKVVSATAKHFPGHGDASTDSHTSLPIINHTKQQWEQLDAPPFRAAIKAGIDKIMTAHIEFPKIDPSGEPATLSPTILTGLLRDELGYNGVVITDSLQMAGVRQLHSDAEIPVLALKAGADELLMPQHLDVAINSVINAVKSGELTESRIDQSVTRILKLKFKRSIVSHPFVDPNRVASVVGTKPHLATAQKIADRSITVLRNDAKLLPLAHKPSSVLVTGWGLTTGQTLAGQIAARGPKASALYTGSAPTAGQISDAVNAANNADLVVVLTNNLPTYPQQIDLLNKLIATGKPVIAVAAQNPYDAGYVDAEQTWLATYGYTSVSTESLAKVIFGEVSPAGKLPVNIPDGNDPTTIKYPFGFGLSW